LFKSILIPPAAKITLKEEWPLLIFTTIASVLTALLAASLVTPVSFNPLAFLTAGVVGAILSVKHLGKKIRACRALINFRTSWLSREIIAFSTFLGLTTLYLLLLPTSSALGWLAALFGFLALFSTDKSYQAATQVHALNFHSAQTLFTGLYLTGALTQIPWLFVPASLLKLVLYLYRKIHFQMRGRDIQFLASALRLGLGFAIPLALQLVVGTSGWIVVSIVAGEILDRLEFYREMDVVSPRRQMYADLQRLWHQL
jgi:DMSO reductase anchor subunit